MIRRRRRRMRDSRLSAAALLAHGGLVDDALSSMLALHACIVICLWLDIL